MAERIEQVARAFATYTIERELGSGGMATVYLAHDKKHDRKVAIKILHAELAAVLGAERFLQEIRVTANLQHPHILGLIDSGIIGEDAGELKGRPYYVMPYVEGESLRQRLEKEQQLPVSDSVRIATEVASALDYAHRHGVIHRDIKPENILLHDGSAIVADFGIALAVTQAGGARMTQTGLSLGTPSYMSPEQAMGERTITARSDIYSLGAVTYEMLSGEPPFTGPTVQAIVARVMTEEPRPLTTQRRNVPPNVAAAVSHALEKVPADRFASAHDFAEALNNPSFTRSARSAAVGRDRSSRRLRGMLYGVTALAILMSATALWGWLRPSSPKQVIRFTIALDSAETLRGFYGRIAISPDGSQLVYAGGPQNELFLRPLSELGTTKLPGTTNAISPYFSPDGTQVVFSTGAYELKVVSLKGGPPVTITDSVVGRSGVSWGNDGFIYDSNRTGEAIDRLLPTPGSAVKVITALDTASGEVGHRLPDPLPNGKGVLFTVYYGANGRKGTAVAVADLATGKHTILVDGLQGRYSPSGHLLYVTSNGTLMAVPFDQSKLKITGQPVAVSEGLRSGAFGAVDLAISRTGTLVFTQGLATTNSELVWVLRNGKIQPVDSMWHAVFGFPSISRDGSRVAVGVATASTIDIWIKQLDHGPSLKLTFEGGLNNYPTWTPDDHSVTYYSTAETNGRNSSLWTKRADGSAQAAVQFGEKDRDVAESLWSPDGKWLVFRTSFNSPGSGDIFAIRPGVDSSPIPLAATKFGEFSPDFSPDGRWLVYSSNKTGRDESYVVPFPNAGSAKWPISTGGGSEPRWSHHGDEIFYRDGSGNMVSVPVKTAPTFSFGAPKTLFPARQFLSSLGQHRQYDVSPDDRRFMMIRTVGSPVPDKLVIVSSWFEELKAKSRK
ncbi:MAG TPA: protein kinase [Gemmatimonadaceae bacterium]